VTDSPIGEILLLWREGSIDDFAKRFMALSCRVTMISEAHQVKLFLAVLRKPLRTNVALHRPLTLDDTIMLARAYEQHETAPPPPVLRHHSSSSACTNLPSYASGAAPTAFVTSSPSVVKLVSSVQRPSYVSIAMNSSRMGTRLCVNSYSALR
jgi:hypothetical protein